MQPVQNQGYCGSCWAFSTIAGFEGAHFIKTGKLLKLSEQQLVDCVNRCYGCDGGDEYYAWLYSKKHPIALRSHYAYTAKDGNCKDSEYVGKVSAVSTVDLDQSVAQHKAAITKIPVNVGVCAGGKPYRYYKSGILDDPDGICGIRHDHANLAIGYGSQNGKDYFILRNSWGSSWGENGYLRIAAMKDGPGVCGVTKDSGYATTN